MAKQKFNRMKMVAEWHKNNGNESAVAAALGVSRGAVRKARAAMDPDLFEMDVENYKKKRADMFAKINMLANQALLLRLKENLDTMGTTELNKIGGTAYDKEKTEQGLPSAIEGHFHVGALSPESLEAIKEFNRIRSEEKFKEINYDD